MKKGDLHHKCLPAKCPFGSRSMCETCNHWPHLVQQRPKNMLATAQVIANHR